MRPTAKVITNGSQRTRTSEKYVCGGIGRAGNQETRGYMSQAEEKDTNSHYDSKQQWKKRRDISKGLFDP